MDLIAEQKNRLRKTVLAARAATPEANRVRNDELRNMRLADFIVSHCPEVVSCYLSSGTEPGTVELVEKLFLQGIKVLVPVLRPRSDATPRNTINWAWYAGKNHLTTGIWNIPEPDGEPLPANILNLAEIIICAGLAGGKDGSRLGTGGGWYDRALAHAKLEAIKIVPLNLSEVFSSVPTQPHDHRVDYLALPTGMLTVS